MAKRSYRTDIPYKDRLLMQKFNTVAEHRNDAARIAMKIACVALNNVEKLGYQRLVRFAEEQQRLTELYYEDPEVQGAHMDERLEQIGFCCAGGRLMGMLDAEGKPVKIKDG